MFLAKADKIDYIKGAEAESKVDRILSCHRYSSISFSKIGEPHNAADVSDQISANLRVIKKADVLKCLTYLHESRKIDMKLFGKQAVYCCKQVNFFFESTQSAVSPEVLQEMQTEQEELKNQTKELKENNTKMRSELGELEKLPPTSEIPIVQSQLKKKWMELQSRLAALETDDPEDREKEKVDLKTPEEISKLDLMIEKYRTLWLDHRKICKQAIRAIQDIMKDEDARSNFLEQIGLEDDSAELCSLEQEQIQSSSTAGMKLQPRHTSHTPVGIKRRLSGTIKV
ncbi:hypothetical protein VP01_1386g5 [Puccinia sorghi]|uniref:Homologous-pairing protein 2 winged helix domain-containing protein n=1 Tax=Puccinia sorghi TaxID=27349 RepID=A0A0L6VLU7_9BASI|nr:hypothetical protein VP01_1386g5 [Puccinia sorghi]